MARKTALVLALLLSLPLPAEAAAPDASNRALAWLSAVDRGAYAQSWAASGALFQAGITDAAWAEKIKPVREAFGAVLVRTLASEKQTATLPGAPDGHYDILTFTTDFAAKKGAVETVVLAEDPGGWKVDGYFIR